MRLLIVGLDGATFDQLLPWVDNGYMPMLKKLLQEGARARLRSTIPPITAPAWSSFVTGLNPGRHGVFGFLRPVEGHSRERVLNSSHDIQGVRLWTVLNHIGQRIGVVDLPMFYPPEEVEGFMLSNVIASGWEKSMSHPERLKEELEAALPCVTKALSGSMLDGVTPTEFYLDRLITSLACKETLDLYLMKRQSWDVFVTVYPHTDVFQHHFWHVLDITHPKYDPRIANRLKPQVQQFASQLDTTISRLIEVLGSGIVILISDHGFGPVKRTVYVNSLLQSSGYLHLKSRRLVRKRITPGAVKKWLTKLDVFGFRRLIGKDLRQQAREVLRKSLIPDIEWAETLAFFELNNESGIWINRRTDFNPEGLEMSESEYETARDQLIEGLRQATDPEGGEKLFEAVYRREQVFVGPYVKYAPDVMLQPAYGYMTSSDFSGEIVDQQPSGLVSGYHRPEGILVVWGPNVQPGELADARIEDMVPTLLSLVDAPVPESLDGRVLDVMVPAHREAHPVRYFDASVLTHRKQVDGQAFSGEDDEAIIRRLRDLGYM